MVAALEQSACHYNLPEILVNCVGGNRGKGPFVDSMRPKPPP